jgi:hypothetical protein
VRRSKLAALVSQRVGLLLESDRSHNQAKDYRDNGGPDKQFPGRKSFWKCDFGEAPKKVHKDNRAN